jgi:hypothetical protein
MKTDRLGSRTFNVHQPSPLAIAAFTLPDRATVPSPPSSKPVTPAAKQRRKENKVENRGVVSDREKVAFKHHNPPRKHHNFTTIYHPPNA